MTGTKTPFDWKLRTNQELVGGSFQMQPLKRQDLENKSMGGTPDSPSLLVRVWLLPG